MSGHSFVGEKVQRGARFERLLPIDYIPPSGFNPINDGDVERRTLKEIKNFILLMDGEAIFALTDLSGKVD